SNKTQEDRMSLLTFAKNVWTGRPQMLKRRQELLAQLESLRQHHEHEIAARRSEQEEARKVLDGYYVRLSEKTASREQQPLTEELQTMARHLSASLPEQAARLERELRAQAQECAGLATFSEVLKRDQTNEPVALWRWSEASIAALKEAIADKQRTLADLLVAD